MFHSLTKKQSATFAAMLGVSVLTGWWAGAFSRSGAMPAADRIPARAETKAAGSKTPDSTAGNAFQVEGAKLTMEEISAVQEELLAILRSGVFEDGAESNDSDTGIRMMRLSARAACLLRKLTQSEKDHVFAQLPEAERGNASVSLKMSSSMMTDREPLTRSDYVERLAGAKEEFERMLTLSRWGAIDPVGLLQYWKTETAKSDAPEWLKNQIGTTFLEIGRANPRLLLSEAMTVKDPALRQSMLQMLHLDSLYAGDKSEWAGSDGLLKQLMAEIPDRREDKLSGVLAMRMKHESPEDARAWVESLELGADSKAWTQKSLLSAWRGQDRVAAAQWMLENTPLGQRSDSIAEYVGWWTDVKLTAGMKRTAPEPDIAACADWILSLGINPDTEKGISVLAGGWIQAGEPAAALAWAQAISDPATRDSCLKQVTTQIERRYPDTWRAMLTAADVPTP